VLYIFVMHSINILIFSLYRYFPKRSILRNILIGYLHIGKVLYIFIMINNIAENTVKIKKNYTKAPESPIFAKNSDFQVKLYKVRQNIVKIP